MRISTNQFYRVNTEQMQTTQSKVAEMQAKLGNGKQLLHPSEDPGQSESRRRPPKRLKARQDTYSKNVDAAQTRLTAEETVPTSMTQLMQRVTELTIQGGNDTLATADRDVIATETSQRSGANCST